MGPGELVAGRFEIVSEAGSGGMGIVYRTIDRLSGRTVALKLLLGREGNVDERFVREGRLLAELSHPRIVRYVAHGLTAERQRYLALEWLDGVDLQRYLSEQSLTAAESVTVARGVAQALAYTHTRGMIHRDIKPSNIFLVNGRVEDVRLLDYGIARMAGGPQALTAVGARIGTPAYMSPEQARGASDVDARTDVYGLGVVLYQCLAGKPPFRALDPVALLGKVLLADPEPLTEVRRDLPRPLTLLVHRMLAKDPNERPPHGGEVLAALEALADQVDLTGAGAPDPALMQESLTPRERRLFSLLLVQAVDRLLQRDDLWKLARQYGGQPEQLVDDSVMVAIAESGSATDLCARAARLALAVRGVAPTVPMALVTGRGVDGVGAVPLGDLLDRAAALLFHDRRRLEDKGLLPTDAPTPAIPVPPPTPLAAGIRVDETTAGLLDASFDVGGDKDGLLLRGERVFVDGRRTLLGRDTPCVAREGELAAMGGAFDACVDESSAKVMVVLAAAGFGKSRLRYEFLGRLAARGTKVELLVGRGDPVARGAPFGLLAGAVRRAAGLFDGEALVVRQKKLRAHLGRRVADADLPRVSQFLGELVGTPSSDDDDIPLRAARADPQLLGDQMRRAFIDWLDAETRVAPLVLVLEDLHWGDAATVSFVDDALRALRERPLFVLALGRLEVEDQFPRLFADRDVTTLRLAELGKRGAERLVREVLGADIAADKVARIVDRAGGNAFYLEELIRAAAEGRDAELPETVLAMVQARLEGMEPEARKILRAASVFGQIFWGGGVQALLGGEETAPTRQWLEELVRREVVTVRRAGKFENDVELTFRHALVRDAAYAMLTDPDRRLGHRLAAAWLAERGEAEPLVLAEHHERGGSPSVAIGWYRRAAEQALGGNDLDGVFVRGAAARRCAKAASTLDDAAVRELASTWVLEAEAHNWRGEFDAGAEAAQRGAAALPVGDELWFSAIGEAAMAFGVKGRGDEVRRLFEALPPTPEPGDRAVLAMTRLAEQLIITGAPEAADQLVARLAPLVAAGSTAATAGRLLSMMTLHRRFQGDAAGAHALAVEAIASFERAADLRNACVQRGRLGYALLEVGFAADAERLLSEVAAQADRMRLANVAATARHNLGLTLARLHRFEEARTVEARAVAEFRQLGNRRMEGASYEYLSLVELEAGDGAAAEQAARAAVAVAEIEPVLPLNLSESLAILAQALLARGRVKEARAASERSVAILAELGGIDDGEALIHLTSVETLFAVGEEARAKAALALAERRLLERMRKMTDVEMRRAFVAVPENARTVALAQKWLKSRAFDR
ncbi:MAG: protein kinase [Myxococcales bacterium]|nr:protein kinase [Myxococcales bacterium]